MTDTSESLDRYASTDPKKPYQTPQLEKLGSVADLTAGGVSLAGEALGYS